MAHMGGAPFRPAGIFRKRTNQNKRARLTRSTTSSSSSSLPGSSSSSSSSSTNPNNLTVSERNALAMETGEGLMISSASYMKGTLLNPAQRIEKMLKSKFKRPRSTTGGDLASSYGQSTKRMGTNSNMLKGGSKMLTSRLKKQNPAGQGEEVVELQDESKRLILLKAAGITVVQVPYILANFLRPHQRVGVQFVFDCVV